MDEIQMPNYVDDPGQFLIWEVDEVMPLGVAICVGVLMNMVTVALIAGFGLVYGYRRLKDGNPDGFAFHWLYWQGLWPVNATTWPNPFAQRYTP